MPSTIFMSLSAFISFTNSLKEKNAGIISEKGVPYMKINESKLMNESNYERKL